MDLRELRYFAATFEARSLTSASRLCFVSQPSISAALASMESELGARLFVRHKKGVTPTAEAETLYPHAKRLLAEASAMRGLFRTGEPEHAFSLGLMRSLDIARTTRLIAFVADAPGLQLRLVGADDPCDARIVERKMSKATETFVSLWRERFVVALPPRHPRALGGPIHAEDLADLPIVARCHCEASGFFLRAGGHPRIVAVAESEEWALALVASGVGVTILPEGSVNDRTDVVVQPLAKPTVSREIGIAFADCTSLPKSGHDVIERLTTFARS